MIFESVPTDISTNGYLEYTICFLILWIQVTFGKAGEAF